MVEYSSTRSILRMRLREILARNLRQARTALELTQEELAEIAQINRGYISALENERYSASLDKIERLADALQVAPGDLLTFKT